MNRTVQGRGHVGGVAALIVVCMPLIAGAAATTFTNPLGDITLYDLLIKILNAVIYILFPVIVLMVVYTGFLFVKAQGNPGKISEANKALAFTLIGAVVVLGSKAIALAIEATVKSIQGS